MNSSAGFIGIALGVILLSIELCTTPGCFMIGKTAGKTVPMTDSCTGSWTLADNRSDPAITLNIQADGTISGFAGVNSYQGKLYKDFRQGIFKLDGALAVTMRMGHNMQQEESFIAALHKADRWQIDSGNTLVLSQNGKILLRFIRTDKKTDHADR